MKKFIIALAAAATYFSAFAESFSPQVIKIYNNEEEEALLQEGAQILRRRGDILLCLIPSSNDNEVVIPNSSRKIRLNDRAKEKSGRDDTSLPHSRRDFSGFNVPTLDAALSQFDASDVIFGRGFDQPYNGNGIVVGICDIGFDPLHPTFLDNNGRSRVKRITQYKEREGFRISLEGDEQYAEWKTDDTDNYHATHVCGILAGNGAGSPYSGVAYGADIVVSTSTLSDVGLLAGVEDIIDYAKEVGKPAVINLSMGNYTGAHDGTSLFSQYLDLCADDAIIILSAGNEGHHTNYLQYDFTEQKCDVGFRLGNKKWDQIDMYGITDIWGNDDSPLTLDIGIYDDESRKIVYSYPTLAIDNYDARLIEWNPEKPIIEGCALDGYLIATIGTDPENGRRQAMIMYDYTSSEKVSGGWARYTVAVTVNGSPGKSVDIFSDGTYTRLMQLAGNPKPGSDMSISDLACGHRVISVGMYGNPEPSTVAYSSYATLHDGRTLPQTVAPGYQMVSALSRPYLDSHPDIEHLQLDAPWLREGGTSMASPYVAGFIAAWLEANPELTAEDVQRIIKETNRTDIPDADDPRNANGWFDPKAAMMSVIHNAGIESIKKPNEIDPEDLVKAYSIDGRLVYEGKAKGCRNLGKGIHILKTASNSIVKMSK